MKSILLVGIGVLIGQYFINHDKKDILSNTDLIVQMIKRGATMEELKKAGDLINKYYPEA